MTAKESRASAKSFKRREAVPEKERQPRVSVVSAAYTFLSSVRFAIFVLCAIAAACVIGTLVPQQAPFPEYEQRYSETTRSILALLSLTDVFHAVWFLGLVSLFGLNLLLCTLRRLEVLIKSRSQRMPSEKALYSMPLHFFLKGREIGYMEPLFRGYRVKREKNGVILEKGILSRYGVYAVHGSIIIILVGGLIGLVFGYRGSVVLGKGESKNFIARKDGSGIIPLGFAIRLDDFNVSFYRNGQPKDYVSRVEIVDQGKTTASSEVRVNHPLFYKGVRVYQASYHVVPVFLFDKAGEEVRLSHGSTYHKDGVSMAVARFESSIRDVGPGVQILYEENGRARTAWFLRDMPQLAQQKIAGATMRLKGIEKEFCTGLEIAYDPGVWVVWAGFVIILFGLYINFFMYHRRIYLLRTASGLLVGGASSRNKEAFKEEFERWREKARDLER